MKEEMIESFSPQDTYELGKRIGETAEAGSVITLIGDLGVGKTVFTQGVADGTGSRTWHYRAGKQSDLYHCTDI